MLANFFIPILMFFSVTALHHVDYYEAMSGMDGVFVYPNKRGSEKDNTRLSDALRAMKFGKNKDRFDFGMTDDQRGHEIQDERGPKVIIITWNDVDSVTDSLRKFLLFMNEDSRLWDADTFRDSSRYNRDVEETTRKLADLLQTLKPGEKKVMFYLGDPDDQRGDQKQDGRKPKLIIITFHTVETDFDSLRKLMPFVNEETRLLDFDRFRYSIRFNRGVDTDTDKLSDACHQLKDGDNHVRIYVGKTIDKNGDHWQDDKNSKLIIISFMDVDSDMDPFRKYKYQQDTMKEDYNRN